jgi:hypothetical protein
MDRIKLGTGQKWNLAGDAEKILLYYFSMKIRLLMRHVSQVPKPACIKGETGLGTCDTWTAHVESLFLIQKGYYTS